MRAEFIKAYAGELSTSHLCRILKISSSGYYDWLERPASVRTIEDKKLIPLIKQSFIDSEKNYGSRRIADDLCDLGLDVKKGRILRLMKQEGLKSSYTKSYRVVSTDSNHLMPVADNVLDRHFDATAPNQKWVGDITYIPTQEGFVYLAVVLDLFSRKVIGFAIDDHMRTELCTSALKQAVIKRNCQNNKKLIHHTDRGSQYASNDYQVLLDSIDAICSMSRKGNCWDNAVCESFFKTFKTECVHKHNFKNLNHAKEIIARHINNYYNQKRKHSSLDYMSPVNYENYYYQQQTKMAA